MVSKAAKIVAATAVAAMLIGQSTVIFNQGISTASAATVTAPKLSVALGTGGSLKLQSAQFLTQDQGKVLAFTVTVTNNGNSDLDLTDYWIKVKSASGKVFSLKVSNADKSITKVTANSSVNITYYSTVDKETKLTDLLFTVVKWDFSVSGYERSLGTIKYPAGYSEKTAVFMPKDVIYNNTVIKDAIKSYVISSDGENEYITLSYLVENKGYKQINLSQAQFHLQTDNGAVFDVDGGSLDKVAVQPGERKLISLYGTVPAGTVKSGLSLVMSIKDAENNLNLPIGAFQIPNKVTQVQSTQTLTGSFNYKDFEIRLQNVLRSSISNSDVMLADLQVVNRSTKAQPILDLSGAFTINGVKVPVTSTQTKVLDQIAQVGPGESYNYVVQAQTDYVNTLNNIQFDVTEKVADSDAYKTLYHFSGTQTTPIPLYEDGSDTYYIPNIGQQARVKLNQSALYELDKYDLFYTEFTYQNNEKRSVTPVQLGGYITNSKGATIPLQFSEFKDTVYPDGSVLLSGWTQVPKSFTNDFVEYVVGQQITSGSSGGGENGDAGGAAANSGSVAKPVKYRIYKAASAPKNDLVDIPFLNYNLSMSKIYATKNVSLSGAGDFLNDGIRFQFDYDLAAETNVEQIADDHKLVLEFVNDDLIGATYTKTFVLDNAEDGEEELEVGQGKTKTIVFEDPDILNQIEDDDKFTLNVYHEFNGYKMLIASKQMVWNYFNP
ncbi:hypothetical protein COLU111180_03455 [Cohnella lubricantis]|uniref:Uncharacterized protein n=1 Tax=Cohnella lubricantis TaxID=2163172 RepID=A0A841TES8_9BACL|nr:hypothetical protein [Cohnella lubricantis]MBB6678766.1 hypothetical protein [Cohnella lubricantis]MBP2117850.1 uncharacterized protein affecting Mg2+/Co2+ transport [Cohnella lubricantis]